MKIVFVTTPYVHRYLKENLEKLKPEFQWKIMEYIDFEDLSKVALELPKHNFDGVVVVGIVAKTIVEKVMPEVQGKVLTLETDLAGIYRLMLNLVIENRNLDFNRVFIDFSALFKKEVNCKDLIDSNSNDLLEKEFYIGNLLSDYSIKDLIDIEAKIKSKVLDLWEEKKIDYVICLFSSLMQFLQDNNIPCSYGFPSTEHIRIVNDKIISLIMMSRYQKMKPAVIKIAIKDTTNTDELDWESVLLHKYILDYSKENMLDFVVKKVLHGVEVYTNKAVVEEITEDYTKCSISKYFSDINIDYKLSIGYGIGKSIKEARDNAANAMHYGECNHGNYLLNEEGTIIGPLNSEGLLICSKETDEKVINMAQKSNLSEMTIQKILHVVKEKGTYDISAQDFIDYFGGTARNANRVLGNLEKAGLATVEYKRSKYNVGRPAKVYHIHEDEV